MRSYDLRPLGAGELLDRAVALYVERFVAVTAVLALILVPYSVLNALLSPQSTRISGDLAALLSAGADAAKSAAANAAYQRDAASSGSQAALAIILTVVATLMWSAVVNVVASSYDGRYVGMRNAYGLALRLWPRQLMTFLLGGLLALVAAIPFVLLAVIVMIAFVTLSTLRLPVAAAFVGVGLGGTLAIAALAACTWLMMTYELASVSVVTEALTPVRALRTAFSRSSARPIRVRVLCAGLIMFAIVFGGAIPFWLIGMFVGGLTHQPLLAYAIQSVGTIVLQGLASVFLVVFAIDVRVRREGIDFALDASGAQSIVSTSPRASVPTSTVSQ